MNDVMWKITVWQSAILGISTSILSIGMRNELPVVSYVFLAVAVFSFLGLSFLWLNRQKPQEIHANMIYFCNILFTGVAVAINQSYWLLSPHPSELFFGHKITALMVAIQTPPTKWVGFSSLVTLIIIPIALMSSWSLEERSHLSAQEPWFTVTLILSCFFVYHQRLQTFKLLHEKIKLETSVQEWKKFAQFLLGLQHLVNSQFQIIGTANEIIERQHPETASWSKKIAQSLEKLSRIARILSRNQEHLQWKEIRMALSIEDLETEMQKISASDQAALDSEF